MGIDDVPSIFTQGNLETAFTGCRIAESVSSYTVQHTNEPNVNF